MRPGSRYRQYLRQTIRMKPYAIGFFGLFASSLLWLIFTGGGIYALLRYSGQPGEGSNAPPILWPERSNLSRVPGRAHLLLFAHPRCPCSAATLGELERLGPFLSDKVKVIVVFLHPEDRSAVWVQDSLWKRAAKIPGANVVADRSGAEAEIFGANTSGQTFLYDESSSLIFSGGLTIARGHMGDSMGRQIILSWIEGNENQRHSAPVFGCALKEVYSAESQEREAL